MFLRGFSGLDQNFQKGGGYVHSGDGSPGPSRRCTRSHTTERQRPHVITATREGQKGVSRGFPDSSKSFKYMRFAFRKQYTSFLGQYPVPTRMESIFELVKFLDS